jgi:hypothetical protein
VRFFGRLRVHSKCRSRVGVTGVLLDGLDVHALREGSAGGVLQVMGNNLGEPGGLPSRRFMPTRAGHHAEPKSAARGTQGRHGEAWLTMVDDLVSS